jgi:hypothetical protein
MAAMHMDPAKSILDRLGVENVARITGKHISRVYRWTYPAGAREGTGGVIPHADAIKLLNYAREEGIPLSEADFMCAPSVASEDVPPLSETEATS